MAIFEGSRYSTYSTQRYFALNTAYTVDIRERVIFDKTNAKQYVWIQGDTIDGLAYKLYDNASYWWAIMDMNEQYTSPEQIHIGDILYIPNIEDIVSVLE